MTNVDRHTRVVEVEGLASLEQALSSAMGGHGRIDWLGRTR
jgi:hypothetical protein